LPPNLTTIEVAAFKGCTSLALTHLPPHLTTIVPLTELPPTITTGAV